MLLWNGARPEEAVTLLSGYKGKLYCSYPEVLALAEEGQLAPLKRDACPNPHGSPIHTLAFPQRDVQTLKVLEWMQEHM